MPRLITLTGPSQAGKSTAIKSFINHSNELYKPVSIPKYSTRESRIDDSTDEVIICEEIPSACNLIYQ